LISGGGIAGLTLGHWLRRHGLHPTILELAPGPRGGGYMIDFWGVGFDVAEKMEILGALEREHCDIPRLEFVDERSAVRAVLEVRRLREMMGGRHFNLLRSGLEKALYEKVKDDVDIRFSTSIRALHQQNGAVEVELSDGTAETFDLVVGADGLRSHTRRLVFGEDDQFERFLGYYTATFTLPNHLGRKDVFQSYTAPERQVGIYSIPNDKLAAFFIFREREPFGHLSREARQERLRAAFFDLGWETPRLLNAMGSADDFYFDAVSQIVMPEWSKGRIALVGDACQCVSLISGQGSGLAMAGAYILATELAHAKRDHSFAFATYQALVQREIARKQRMAVRFASSFVPESRAGIVVRNALLGVMRFRPAMRYFIRRFISDQLVLEPT
jgi:2-polyprenyl-6-methoxyphenol hydroxylase-like FAD-dependent oxidoreductase